MRGTCCGTPQPWRRAVHVLGTLCAGPRLQHRQPGPFFPSNTVCGGLSQTHLALHSLIISTTQSSSFSFLCFFFFFVGLFFFSFAFFFSFTTIYDQGRL